MFGFMFSCLELAARNPHIVVSEKSPRVTDSLKQKRPRVKRVKPLQKKSVIKGLIVTFPY